MGFAHPLGGVRSILLLVAVTGPIGCSKEVRVETKLDPAHENLMRIGSAYVQFNTKNKRPPKSVEDIKPFLKEFGNIDDLLRSPRDGQPFVICWGVDLLVAPKWAKSTPILAYEKRGAEGTRYILTTLRSVEQMSDEQFQQASFPPGHPRPS
jgi:hypothetical protein